MYMWFFLHETGSKKTLGMPCLYVPFVCERFLCVPVMECGVYSQFIKGFEFML